jgi:hypothetical protein
MKNTMRLFSFAYGCLGTIGFLICYIFALLGRATMPDDIWLAEVVFALHGIVAIATFQRMPVRPAWPPLLRLTDSRIRLTRILIGVSILNFLLCLGALVFAAVNANAPLEAKAVPLVLTSFLLQNTIYIAAHWAFRPENLFSGGFLRSISNPLGALFPKR